MSPREYSIYTIHREDRAYAGPVHQFHEWGFGARELQPIVPLADHVAKTDEVVLYDQPVVELRTGPTESVFLAIEPRLARMFEYAARAGLKAEYELPLREAEKREREWSDEVWRMRRARAAFNAMPWWKRAWRVLLAEL